MFKVAICDDDAEELAKIERYVRSYADFELCVYSDSRKLIQDIKDGEAFDLYLLDIIMPKPDGLELAHLIRKTDKTAVIIFLTSHEGRALDAYRVRAAQYLTKPISQETLRGELDIALSAARAKKGKILMLKTKAGMKSIPFHKVVYCELERRCLICISADGKKYASVMLRIPFVDAVAPLLEDRRFIRPHKSFVVNMDFVSDMSTSKFLMKTGEAVPIAQSAQAETRDKYMGHFFWDERE